MTIFGTRPEIIRLSVIMRVLDDNSEHIMVHTGQNYDENLSDIFFREMAVRAPDVALGIRSTSFGDQIGKILSGVDEVLESHRPDKVVILGDTNSALSALLCARRGIPVFHLEAGNRCFDNRVPEEVNRRVIDHSSTFLLPYTMRSKENLLAEGIERERIIVTGNPINEVLLQFSDSIDNSRGLDDHAVETGNYFLATVHRAENVDDRERLVNIFAGLNKIANEWQKRVLVSVHPRTREKLLSFGVAIDNARIRLLDPLGFFDFVKLEKNALAVLTDSGTVQEECAIFRVPNITLRDVTERPETVECGSNILSGAEPETIVRCTSIAISQGSDWSAPSEYLVENVSRAVAKAVLGYSSIRDHS